MNDVPDRARGKWQQILLSMGFTHENLNGRHQACPVTGEKGKGSPRFRFSNKDGKGNFFCACSEGNEDGFALLKCRFGWDFKKACEEVNKVLPQTGYDNDVKKRADKEAAARSIHQIVSSSRHVDEEVVSYLASRGLAPTPALRQVRTRYGIDRELVAMVARIRDAEGKPISLHLTYLEGGEKAKIETPRIVCTPTSPTVKGGAVRLFPAGPRLGVAEGIETALSAAQLFDLPVWAVLSTAGMESFCWPEGTQELVIFGDNDEKFGGQAAAYRLAHRARTAKTPVPIVTVNIPDVIGCDWNDILIYRQKAGK